VATGEGLSPWILGSVGCPGGGVGGPCFRTDAFRILMVVTDAPMHEGPPGVEPVAPYDFEGPHDYAATTAAVEAADLFVIGLGATDLGRPTPFEHLAALGRDTGSVDASGRPLPGFTLADMPELFGDEFDAVVKWKNGTDLTALRGKTIRLRVQLKDADLYALRFAD
jgi:hypothetical protein